MARRGDQDLIGRVWCERFEILEMIGRGGMGSVFMARQLQIDREVALKVIHRKLTQDEKQVQRFEREARAASKLAHPNNIRVYDYGVGEDARLFIAMELLRGETLADMIAKQGALPAQRVVHITKQLCKALAEAHQLGLVHRDLKPENIFLTEVYGEKDFVKVLDFGIAKSLTSTKEAADLTQTGFICGTPRYISPEQALGQPVDGRADLYAVAVLMYEMLTGRPPFLGENPISIVMKHVYDDPPPLTGMERYGVLGKRLTKLVTALLEKNPARRPDSAEKVLAYLNGAIEDEAVVGRQEPPQELLATGRLPSFEDATRGSGLEGGPGPPPPLPMEGDESTSMLGNLSGGGGQATAMMQQPADLRSFIESRPSLGDDDDEPAATMMMDAVVGPPIGSPVEQQQEEGVGATQMMSQDEVEKGLREFQQRVKRRQTGLVRVNRADTGHISTTAPPSGAAAPELEVGRRRGRTPTWALIASGVAISVIILAVFVMVMTPKDEGSEPTAVAADESAQSTSAEERRKAADEADDEDEAAEDEADAKAAKKAEAKKAAAKKAEASEAKAAAAGDAAEAKPAEGETAEAKPAEGETAEAKPAEGETAEAEPAEGEAAEAKVAEEAKVEPAVVGDAGRALGKALAAAEAPEAPATAAAAPVKKVVAKKKAPSKPKPKPRPKKKKPTFSVF